MRPTQSVRRAALALIGAGALAAPAWSTPPTALPGPYSGCVNHAHQAAPFQWGAFGANHYYPRVGWRRDYNNELLRWSVHRRY